MSCPVSRLPHIMPAEELIMWRYRYEFGKFGKKLDDYRFATQAKITDLCFSNGKINPPVEKYIPAFTVIDHKAIVNQNLAIANAFFGGVIPKEVMENVNSCKSDSTTEA